VIEQAQSRRFVEAVFGRIFAPSWALVWTFPDLVSRWSVDADSASIDAARCAETQDTYIGCCLRAKKPRKGRGGIDSVSALHAVWLDIDHQSEHRKSNENLPETVEQCNEILELIELRPSIEVLSGYGVQAWWLFRAPLVIDDGDSRAEASTLVEAFTRRTQRLAKVAGGWRVDSAFSLDHVLRLPGTLNWKEKTSPRPVSIRYECAARYRIEELQELCVEELYEVERKRAAEAGRVGTEVGPLTLVQDLEPPAAKLMAALDNEPKFRRTWRRQRPELSDQSQSGYDMALATFAAGWSWDDQEILALLVAHCRQHGTSELKRLGYYQRTIARAHDLVASRGQTPEAEALEIDKAIAAGPAEAVQVLRDKLRIPVSGLKKRDGDPARYYLVLDGHGDVALGEARKVLSQGAVRSAVLEATGHLIPPRKQGAWDSIVRLLFSVIEIVRIEENQRRNETISWIESYLEKLTVPEQWVEGTHEHSEEFRDAVTTRRPFRTNGHVFVNTEGLRAVLDASNIAKIAAQELRYRLSEVGFDPQDITAKVGGRAVRRTYWAGPGALVGLALVDAEDSLKEVAQTPSEKVVDLFGTQPEPALFSGDSQPEPGWNDGP
jgi:hypothetical protein